MLAMLSASGASPSFCSLPVAASIDSAVTRNGCERSAAYSTRLSWLTTIGITVPPTWSVCTGLSTPCARSSSSTEISWLSALDT
jgi:hypothetical protein